MFAIDFTNVVRKLTWEKMGPIECKLALWTLKADAKRNAKDSSLEFHSTNETEMNEFGVDRNLGNYDLFIISYSIMLEVGVKLQASSYCCLKIIMKKFI